ncbi:hypothetical protein BSY19_5053 (plasmid) [Bosea sp. RAC05]|nr:hypothetical protein BSY19_5053 [Bosea sp. RAC05]
MSQEFSMVLGRMELYELLGLDNVDLKTLDPGGFRQIMEDGPRRATITIVGRFISANLVELVDGDDAIPIVNLDGRYDAEDDSFLVTGEDASGESSEPRDPRSAASIWRRLTRGMPVITA